VPPRNAPGSVAGLPVGVGSQMVVWVLRPRARLVRQASVCAVFGRKAPAAAVTGVSARNPAGQPGRGLFPTPASRTNAPDGPDHDPGVEHHAVAAAACEGAATRAAPDPAVQAPSTAPPARVQVAYSGRDGNMPRYARVGGHMLLHGNSACQSLGGQRIERAVAGVFLEAVSPAGARASAEAVRERERQHAAAARPAAGSGAGRVEAGQSPPPARRPRGRAPPGRALAWGAARGGALGARARS
jgi:hypothetical protein